MAFIALALTVLSMNYSVLKHSRKVIGVLVAAIVLATGFSATPASALTGSGTGSSGVPGTVILGANDTNGVKVGASSTAPRIVGQAHTGWEYVSFQATDVYGNKLPRGAVSNNWDYAGKSTGEVSHVAYWNWMWWGGSANSPDLSAAHENDMNNNCDDNSYLWPNRLNDNSWKRRWASSTPDHLALITNRNNRFGSYGTRNDNYYINNAGPFTGAPWNWNGNRDHTNLTNEANGWWSGCVRYQTFRKTYTPIYQVDYSMWTDAPCGRVNNYSGYLQEVGAGSLPNTMTLSATVSSGNLTQSRLSFNNALQHVITINNPTTCQGPIAGPANAPIAAFDYPATIYSGDNATFVNRSQPGSPYYPINRWSWTAQNANGQTIATSSQASAIFNFNTTGSATSYTPRQVCLTVYDTRNLASQPFCRSPQVIDRYVSPSVTYADPGVQLRGQVRTITANATAGSTPINSYSWSVTSGNASITNANSRDAQVAFTTVGVVRLQVVATDAFGATATFSRNITVLPSVGPSVTITGPTEVDSGNNIPVTAVPGGTFPPTSYTWTVDGCPGATINPNGQNAVVTPGTNCSSVTVRVTIDTILGPATDTHTVTIRSTTPSTLMPS